MVETRSQKKDVPKGYVSKFVLEAFVNICDLTSES